MAWIMNQETQVKWEIVDEELLARLLANDYYKEVVAQMPLKKNSKIAEKEK